LELIKLREEMYRMTEAAPESVANTSTVSVILETKKLILSKTQENYYMNRVKKGELFRG
jgi:hypothetical protein